MWDTCKTCCPNTLSASDMSTVLQDTNNRLSFTLERPCACPITCLPWPFNCTILSPLKVFVRGATGELSCQTFPTALCTWCTNLGLHVLDRQDRTSASLSSAACIITLLLLLQLPIECPWQLCMQACSCGSMHQPQAHAGSTCIACHTHLGQGRHTAGGVLGYAQQVTKCCNCSGFIEVMDASNQLMYTIEGEVPFQSGQYLRQASYYAAPGVSQICSMHSIVDLILILGMQPDLHQQSDAVRCLAKLLKHPTPLHTAAMCETAICLMQQQCGKPFRLRWDKLHYSAQTTAYRNKTLIPLLLLLHRCSVSPYTRVCSPQQSLLQNMLRMV